MLTEMDFENLFNQICSDVGNNVQENSRLFALCDSDLKRVAFVLNLEAVACQLEELRTVLKNVTNFKSSESATAFRNQGNICFQKKTNLSALQYYNKSIIAAPTNHGDELSLAFANRSAVLMDLNKWMLCLRDIALAFSYHYPTNLHYKLYERQGNCWLKLGNVEQASNSFKLAIKSLQHANLDQGKLNKIALNLEHKLSNLTISCEVICEVEMTVEKMEQEIWRCRETTPKLNREINPKLPCASMSIKMAQSPEKGRHLVANEDLAPGVTVIVEKAFSSILLMEHEDTHCHHCLYWTLAPIPCHNCSQVRFCSVACRDQASYHGMECGLSDFLDAANLGKHGLLALRTAARVGYRTLMDVAAMSAHRSDPQEVVYDSSDYLTIFNLIANTDQRSVADLFRRTVMALYLATVLEHGNFWTDGDHLEAVASVLLRHLQNYPCNAHEISQLCIPNMDDDLSGRGVDVSDLSNRFSNLSIGQAPATVRQAYLSEVGAGAYGCLSLINHSCDPNVVRHCVGDVAVVTTIRCIAAGQEIVDNYGYHYATHPLKERHNKLLKQYYFRCLCPACVHQWPLYRHIDDRLKLTACRLEKCATGSCSDCLQRLAELQTSTDLFQTQLQTLMALPCRETDAGYWRQMSRLFSQHIRLLDCNVQRPTRQYNEAQEALKQCLALSSTVYFECCS